MGKELTKYDAKLAEMAKQAAGAEDSVGGDSISTKGGRFSHKDEDLGTDLVVVILDAVRENAYYKSRYDPKAEQGLPPVCFALGREKDLIPHDAVVESEEGDHFEPQAETCTGCPMNEYGSSDTGRGKACGNRRRLALLTAGEITPGTRKRSEEITIFDDPRDYADGAIALLRLSPTSLKGWSAYVRSLNEAYQRPPCAVITRITIVPDDNAQFLLQFSVIEELSDEILEAVLDRVDEAGDMLMVPYQKPSKEMLAKAKQGGKGRNALAGLRKTRT